MTLTSHPRRRRSRRRPDRRPRPVAPAAGSTTGAPRTPSSGRRPARAVARRNLIWSIFAEHLGFSVWLIWSVSSAFLVATGFDYSPQQLFLLVALPNLVGSLLRLPYTFAVPKFGGRNWTMASAALLLIPTLGFAYAVQRPDTPYWVFCLIAATAGLGGGNFASSMANINFFYPAAKKGAALGLNAAGGNLGVALIQLFLPVIVGGAGIFGIVKASEGGIHLERAAWVYAGLAVVATLAAYFFMDNLGTAQVLAARAAAGGPQAPDLDHGVPLHRHLRLVHRLLRRDAAADQAQLLGAGAGAARHRHLLRLLRVPRCARRLRDPAVRRLAGRPVRRRAGSRSVRSAAMVVFTLAVLWTLHAAHAEPRPPTRRSPRPTSRGSRGSWRFFLCVFAATGIGNGSTYKMIPAIWRTEAERATTPGHAGAHRRAARRHQAGVGGDRRHRRGRRASAAS